MAALLGEHTRQLQELADARNEDRVRFEDAQRRFEELRATVELLVQQEERQRGYTPTPPPRWWQLDGAAREEAIDVLRNWVESVFRPCYERYARDLGPCWEQHPLALLLLDWLSEWHKVLYLREIRGPGHLTSMAEWHARFLPIVAEMLKATTTGCPHADQAALDSYPVNGYAVNGYDGGPG
jgi:hypothetical protein